MITYTTGNAAQPHDTGKHIIAHICNNVGAWGAGFTKSLSARWDEPKRSYQAWKQHQRPVPFALGNVLLVEVETDVWVAHMVAQRGLRSRSNPTPIDYDALAQCLETVASMAQQVGAGVVMPRIGTGLAGGKWERMQPLIEATLCARGVCVTVYTQGL